MEYTSPFGGYVRRVPRGNKAPPGPLSRYIAAELNREVRERGITQATLGNILGVSQSDVSKMLRAERPMTIDELDALCRVLGWSLSAFVGEADKATKDRR